MISAISVPNNKARNAVLNVSITERGPKRTPFIVRTWLTVATLVCAILYVPTQGLFWLSLANLSAITAIGAMGLTVLVGTAGLLSLGQAAFLAIGGFTAAFPVTYTGLGFLACLVLGGTAAALVGVVVSAATTRTIGIYLAVGTLALQYVVEIILSDVEVKLTAALGFQMGMPSVLGWEISTERAWWYLLCLMAFMVWGGLRAIVRGQPGRNWVCMKENSAVASSLGISVTRSRMAVFALSSFVAGMAGVLHGFYVGTVQITNYSLHLSIIYLTIVVLGRAGSIGGAIWVI